MRLSALQGQRAALLVIVAVLLGGLPPGAQAQYFRFGKNKIQYEAHDWHFVQSTHFDIYYYEGGRDLADFTARAAEDAYRQIEELFQHQIADRIPLIVYQSHNDFAVTNAVNLPTYSEGIGGVTELFKNRIALPFTGDYREYRRVVHHELVHAVINDMFYGGSLQSVLQNNIQLRIPLWFNEGLAEYAALGWDSQSDMYVREAILEDNLADIERLYGYFAYRGGQSVWDYVAEQYGREKIGEILQRLRLSRSVEGSFKRATGLTLKELSARWHKTLKEIYFPEIAAREDLDDVAKAILTRDNAGYYNTSPALSPQGDKVAYVTTRSGLFDVYLASANDGTVLRKLVEGQTSMEFESLRILSPGLSWSPDGTQIALAVKSGKSDALAVVDVETGEAVQHYRIPGLDQIVSVAWSPLGDKIAFEASKDAQSDIYVLDLTTHETVNYTNDVFSDHEPAWSPDGTMLVFHSDRGDYTQPGRYQADTFEMIAHDYSQDDVYLLRLDAVSIERVTTTALWDDQSAKFGGANDRVLFISDRNGIYNLYEKNLLTGEERPLTDLSIGVTQVSLSADGKKAAVVSLKEGTPSIYLLKTPFERQVEKEVLAPNVWAQRLMQETDEPAPALALASASLRQNNPFLRDAADGAAFARTVDRVQQEYTTRAALLAQLEADEAGLFVSVYDFAARHKGNGTNGSQLVEGTHGSNGTNGHESEETAEDSTLYGTVKVDFRNYVFDESFDQAAMDDEDYALRADRFSPEDHVEEDGRYKPKKYKLDFSPDLVYGTAGYDVLYGMQGVTQMMFSDMLGNHQIFVATNLLIDLRNSDYVISYSYLPRRIDWSLSGYHISRLLLDASLIRAHRYRWYGLGVTASIPLDKFRRLDADLSVMGVSQADITDAATPAITRSLLFPSITFTRDATTPGFLYPSDGRRFALKLAGSPFSFDDGRVRFLTVLADARAYTSFGRGRYSFAVRGSGGTSIGPTQQLFYSSGVQNWINRNFDDENGFPVANATDFIFATPVLPLRGYEINTQNGTNFGLFNAEFRFPLIAALLPGPLPILPLYNIQGTAFLDAGALWGGRGLDNRLNFFRDDANGDRVLDDLLVGAGLGLRTLLLGYPIRLDYAWPFDGRRFGKRQVYFSVGLDF